MRQPIADDAAKYEAKKKGKMEGASLDTFKLIDSLKPYEKGNDLLWALYRLNNIEKHRLLITVGSMFHSLDFGTRMLEDMRRDIAADPTNPFHGKELPTIPEFFLTPKDALFPLKDGDELFVDLPDAEVSKMKFHFAVALYEPKVLQPQALGPLLHRLISLVSGVVVCLEPRLK